RCCRERTDPARRAGVRVHRPPPGGGDRERGTMTRQSRLAVIALLVVCASSAALADGDAGHMPAACNAPLALRTIEPPLVRVAARITKREPLTIVAVG